MTSTSLERFGVCTLDQDGCSTCGDIAVPVRVIWVKEASAMVEDRLGVRAEVAVDFIENARPGDVLLVHMGVAIARAGEA
ncbi:MAG: HypC/HybG/HupF family hydrogenase formation chaperone [Deinococcus sp.]|nr:HypC/HybG/HupF family hydrogenase formation chaperone [Deinococcus sp.]MCL5964637.1 HypC/HybG/HupF family hydrogenase formation chaperone [Deinococcus sp.]